MFPDYDIQDGGTSKDDHELMVDYEEMKNLKLRVQRLVEDKEYLEESLTDVSHEKEVIYNDHQVTVNKMSVLENEVLALKQQVCFVYYSDFSQGQCFTLKV